MGSSISFQADPLGDAPTVVPDEETSNNMLSGNPVKATRPVGSDGYQGLSALSQPTVKDCSASGVVNSVETSPVVSQTVQVGDSAYSDHVGGSPAVQFLGQAAMTGGNVVAGNLSITNNYSYGPLSNSGTDDQVGAEKTVNFHAIHLENVEKRTEGTLDWFTDSEDYQTWKNGGCRVIWGTGIPGAGKTVLASRIVDDLRQFKATSTKKICVVFAYCRYSERLTIKDILEALIKQFLAVDPSLIALARSLYDQHEKNKTRPTQRELFDLLRQMEGGFEVVFYVIDGLDEAQVDTQFDLIEAIKDGLRGQFALTSRPLESFQSELPATRFYTIRAHHSDIVRLVLQKIERNPAFRRLLQRHSYLDELVQRIADKSNGMFLHAALQIEFIQHCPTIGQMEEALRRFPAKIEDLYVKAMNRINEQEKPRADLANHVLLWLVFGREALTFPDLQHALRLTLPNYDGEVHKDDLLSVCCGLVTVEDKTTLVRLVHFTAQGSLAPLLKEYLPETHGLLFKATTQRLVECRIPSNAGGLKTLDDLFGEFDRCPLLPYSYHHWAYHAEESMVNPEYVDAVRQFVFQCTSFPHDSYFRLILLSPLHVAAQYGFHELLDSALTATTEGNVALRTGGEIDLTALMLASRHGHTETVDALLAHSPRTVLRPVFKGGKGRPWTHFSKAQINLCDCYGWTALMYAVFHGHNGVVQRLLAHKGIKVNTTDKTGWTALMRASAAGQESNVQLLLGTPNIDVNVANREGNTALILASRGGFPEVVRLLLQHNRIDVNRKDKLGRTAIMAAQEALRTESYSSVRDGCQEVIKVLTEFAPRSASSSK